MYANPPRPSVALCVAACTARIARRKKTAIAVCLCLFALAAAPPVVHLSILAACGAAAPPELPENSAICQFVGWLGLGQGALIPGLAAIAVVAIAVFVGIWCARNVFRDDREQRYLLAKAPTTD